MKDSGASGYAFLPDLQAVRNGSCQWALTGASCKAGFWNRREDGSRLPARRPARGGAWPWLRRPLWTAYERLRIAYSRNIFTESDTPQTISAKLGENVSALIRPEDIPFLVDHPVYDLVIHTARSRGPAASENSYVQGGALIVAALANVMSPAAMKMAYERVVFYSGAEGSEFLRDSFTGRAVRLTPDNVAQAALATGSLPCIVAGVRNIKGAPEGVYRDGGIIDYQLNQDYRPGDEGITLFFHYQERIVPGWFDKALSWRKPARACTDRLVQVYPGQDFINLLPDRSLPDRNDFKTFLHDPAERIRRWDRASELSAILWDEFAEAVESNRIKELVRPL